MAGLLKAKGSSWYETNSIKATLTTIKLYQVHTNNYFT